MRSILLPWTAAKVLMSHGWGWDVYDVHVSLREFNTGRLRFSYFRTTEQNRHCFVQFANQKLKSHLLTPESYELKKSHAAMGFFLTPHIFYDCIRQMIESYNTRHF